MTVIGFPPKAWTKPKTLEDWPWDQDLGKPHIDINIPLDCRPPSEVHLFETRQQMAQSDLLRERERTHGDYGTKCTIIMDILRVIECHRGGLSDIQNVSLDMIIHKMGRILAGDADYPDHWRDISGYALLVLGEVEDAGC